MKYFLLSLAIYIPFICFSQKYTLHGFIRDQANGEELFGSSIYENENLKGTTSNEYGFYSITLPEGEYEFVFSYIGFKTLKKTIVLDKNVELNIELEKSISIKEVVVKATKNERIHETSKSSTISIPIEQIEALPNIGGEPDVLKALQLLPGVQSGNEGTSGLYVRGGGPDQNLILLDGVPVYNASHLFGFISVFNSNAISSVELIKGGFPARYGGRLSSVIDIRMKEGNMKEFHGDFSIGLLATRLTLEGPIIKDRTSFILSARRTYLDVLMRPISAAAFKSQGIEGSVGYAFTDINAKINHKISNKDRVFLSFYYGDDNFGATTKFKDDENGDQFESKFNTGLNYGNITTALRYNHKFSPKVFLNTSLTYSRYKFNVSNGTADSFVSATDTSQNYSFESEIDYFSGINDWALKLDFDFLPHPNHYIKYGIQGTYHTFNPGVNSVYIKENNAAIENEGGSKKINTGELAAYVEDDFKIGSKLKLNLGTHASIYYVRRKKYWSVQPRISANYNFVRNWSLKASFSTMTQYLHLLSNAGIGLPTDLWVPPTENIKPQQSWQVAGGIAATLFDQLEISVEGYYKKMSGLIDYKEGASFFSLNSDWQDKVETDGTGESYGAEFFLQRKKGKFTGWVGYTLSWSFRQFDELNFGKKFPYVYDRRHDLSVVLMYKLGPKVDFSGSWVYGTGNALTIPNSTYLSEDGNTINNYGEKNSARMPAYHRLDLGVNFHKQKKVGEVIWNISLYNAYSRQNPFYVYLGYENNGSNQKAYRQVSLFPILPSFSYRRKF